MMDPMEAEYPQMALIEAGRETVVMARYTNYYGVRTTRRFKPIRLWWGVTDHHPEPGWILTVWDFDKSGARDYALSGFLPDGGAGRGGEGSPGEASQVDPGRV